MIEEKQWWYFTIKPGTKRRKKFFKIFGTMKEARREANKRYHDDWDVQYAEVLWNALLEGKGIDDFLTEDNDGEEQG